MEPELQRGWLGRSCVCGAGAILTTVMHRIPSVYKHHSMVSELRRGNANPGDNLESCSVDDSDNSAYCFDANVIGIETGGL